MVGGGRVKYYQYKKDGGGGAQQVLLCIEWVGAANGLRPAIFP